MKLSSRLLPVLILLTIGSSFISVGSSLQSSAATNPLANAVQGLQSCIHSRPQSQLNVVAMIDESGSLFDGSSGGSDPFNQRTVALKELISQLSALSITNKINVQMAMIGFASGIDPVLTTFTDVISKKQLLLEKASLFTNKNLKYPFDQNTNFFAGLKAARSLFALANTKNPNSCSMLLWITDGGIDIRELPSLNQRMSIPKSIESMCAPGSPADQLAKQGVFTFAIGLTTPGYGMSPQNASELQSYVEGGGNDVTTKCGSFISTQTGAFFTESDASNLIFALAAAIDPSASLQPTNIDSCAQPTPCTNKVSKTVGEGVDQFILNAATPQNSPLSLFVVAPNGEHVELGGQHASSANLSGTNLLLQALGDNALQLNGIVTNPGKASAANGVWAFEFISATSTNYTLTLHSYLSLVLPKNVQFTRSATPDQGAIRVFDNVLKRYVSWPKISGIQVAISPSESSTNVAPVTLTLENGLTSTGGDRWKYSFLNTFSSSSLQVISSAYLNIAHSSDLVLISNPLTVSSPLSEDYPQITISSSSNPVVKTNSPLVFHLNAINKPGVSGQVILKKLWITSDGNVDFTTSTNGQLVTSAAAPFNVPITVKILHNPQSSRAVLHVQLSVKGRTQLWQSQTLQQVFLVSHVVSNLKATLKTFGFLLFGIMLLLFALRYINKRFAVFQPNPYYLKTRTYDVALSAGSGFLSPTFPHDSMFLEVPELTDSVISHNERYFEIPNAQVNGIIKIASFWNLKKSLFGTNHSYLQGASRFFACAPSNSSDVIDSGESFSIELPSLVPSNIWIFQSDGLIESNGFSTSTGQNSGPMLLGKFTILIENVDNFNQIVSEAATTLSGEDILEFFIEQLNTDTYQ